MRVIVSVSLVLCFLGLAHAQLDPWKTYSSKEGKFSILWPGEPEISKAKHPITGVIKTHFEAKSPGSSIQFLFVDVADLPADEVKRNGFDGTVKALKEVLTTGLGGTIVSEDSITIGKAKHPAKDFLLYLPDKVSYVRFRACLAGERVYTLTLVAPKETIEGKLVGKIISSFTPDD